MAYEGSLLTLAHSVSNLTHVPASARLSSASIARAVNVACRSTSCFDAARFCSVLYRKQNRAVMGLKSVKMTREELL